MSIWFRDLGPDGEKEWTVDFEAGFQRGLFPFQDREALCERLPSDLPRIDSRMPWLRWIGLDPHSDLLTGWLNGEAVP